MHRQADSQTIITQTSKAQHTEFIIENTTEIGGKENYLSIKMNSIRPLCPSMRKQKLKRWTTSCGTKHTIPPVPRPRASSPFPPQQREPSGQDGCGAQESSVGGARPRESQCCLSHPPCSRTPGSCPRPAHNARLSCPQLFFTRPLAPFSTSAPSAVRANLVLRLCETLPSSDANRFLHHARRQFCSRRRRRHPM